MKTKTKRPSDTRVLDLKKFKRLPRGAFLARTGETEPGNTKVRISILLDLDVLNFFQGESIKGGRARLSTQINQILRLHLEGKESVDSKTPAQDDRLSELWKNV